MLHESDLQSTPPPRRAGTSSSGSSAVPEKQSQPTTPGPLDDIDQLLEFEADMANDGVLEEEPVEVDPPPTAVDKSREFDDDDTADLSQFDDGDLFGDLEQLQSSNDVATGDQHQATSTNTKLSRSQVIDLSAADDVDERIPRKSVKTKDKQLANRTVSQDD